MSEACCRKLLSEGLDLCVRARRLDMQERTNVIADRSPGTDLARYAARYNLDEDNAHRPVASRSGTIALWVQDQYERDLADWEGRARKHLMEGCGDA